MSSNRLKPVIRPVRRASLATRRARRDKVRHRASEEADRARLGLVLLAEASAILGESLDAVAVIERAAQLFVPAFADWCMAFVVGEDGSLRRAALATATPEQMATLLAAEAFLPLAPEVDHPVKEIVLRRGHSTLMTTIDDPYLTRVTTGPEHLALMQRLSPGSSITVPLAARGRILGAWWFGRSTARARYTTTDLALAEDLARRAATAIENSRLYEAIQADIAERMRVEGELRQAVTQLRALSERLVEVQEAERAHLARELHDEIGQLLTGLSLSLAVGPRTTPEQLHERLAAAQRQVGGLIAQVRALSLNLRPAMIDDLGLIPALRWFVQRYTDQTGIQVMFQHAGVEASLPPAVAITAYRVVQESLTNIARHAQASAARVQIWVVDHLLAVQVVDEGRGFDVAAALASGASSGLAGMGERVRLLGGSLTIDSAPGSGTRILAEIPRGSRERGEHL